jgi:hypothetical protein
MSYGEINRTYSEVRTEAASQGQRVVAADDYTLQIDIDSEEDAEKWKRGSEILLRAINGKEVTIIESKSGFPHRHITIHLNKAMDVWERIALQLCLGSHVTRETLNSYRVLVGNECPIVFFEEDNKKDKKHIRMIRVNPEGSK